MQIYRKEKNLVQIKAQEIMGFMGWMINSVSEVLQG
jgi:hypothetical protein